MGLKYFVCDADRKGTCYHEFYKGKWDGETFWKEDSISIHDDVLYENAGFEEAIYEVIPSYYPFGETEVSFDEWKKIGEIILQKDKRVQELYNEVDEWLKSVFEVYGCFTILGI